MSIFLLKKEQKKNFSDFSQVAFHFQFKSIGLAGNYSLRFSSSIIILLLIIEHNHYLPVMAALNIAPVLPNPLLQENPPNRNTHMAQIDPWVIYLLRTTIESDVHYESQLHGPIGVFLESNFPQRRRFMNIAQATLREVVSPEDIDDDLGNISFGSTGAEHQSRNVRK